MFSDSLSFGAKSEPARIDMGPLIDMVFILLIFFVITTNFTRQTGIEVTRPKASSAISQGEKVMMIGISREGSYHVYGRQVSLDGLEQLISKEVKRKPELSIVIVADRGAEIGNAVSVMDRCTASGATNVSIAADK